MKDIAPDINALNNASIKDENCSGLASFAFPEAKSSKTGVSVRYAPCAEREWYVLRIKYGQVQTVADAVSDISQECGLRQWRIGKLLLSWPLPTK